MTTKVQKSGNCLSINIPKELALKAKITKGSRVSFDFRAGKILVIPEKKEETLAELLKGLTPENRHELVDWGSDVGREIIEPYEAVPKKRRHSNC